MIMEDDKQTFLNLVIQKADSNNIQDFMRAWLRQECKDFKLVFIQKEHTSKQAIRYACGFANAIGYGDLVVAVPENEVPEAKMTRILKDTSVLPVDKMEVLKIKSKANNQKTNNSASEKNGVKQEVKLVKFSSSNNSKEEVKAINVQSRQDEDVTVAMATQPCRVEAYVDVVYQLLSQCTRMCICFNGFDEIPKNLPKSKKIIAICANGKNGNPPDLGCNNKMYWLGDFPGYYATVDDDIIYPPNYIQTLKNAVDKYDKKAIVSFHGHIYKPVNGKINVRDKQLLWYKLKHDTQYCHRLGMGVAMSYPSKLNLSKNIFLNHPKNTGDDELMALWAQKNNIPMICLSTRNISILSNDRFALKNCLSSGNNTIKKRKQLLENFTSWKINELECENELTIAMASQPHRCQQMLSVIKTLLPFCTRFCISLNGYDNIPEELVELKKQSDKIITVLTGKGHNVKDLGNLNKMYWLGDFPGYYATVDDDLNYSKTYLDTLIYNMKLHADLAICSYHGLLFKTNNGIVDLNTKKIIFYNKINETNQVCLRPGMGTAIMNPQKLGISKNLYLCHEKGYSDDIITSIFAQQHNIPCIVVKHGENEVTATDYAFSGLYKNKNVQAIRTKQMLEYKDWKYNWD